MRKASVGIDRRLVLAGGGAALLIPSAAQAAPANALPPQPDAASRLTEERAAAAREGKHVLISFFASWCGWCTPMNAVFEDNAVRPILERHYRLVHMRVIERSVARRAQQWANADAVYHRFATAGDGLPFLVILDANGSLLSSSRSPAINENIGFPTTPADFTWFDTMFRTGAPDLSTDDLAVVRASFVRHYG
ncbi:thioredoxin family protein [Terricaulis sp.]|uniref:thioredoxin family protein n=1 Tax=Terricaulis sp. TaxID=2768686 RepID=UPI003783C608